MIFSPKDDFNLARIADSGQCFRFNQTDTNEYSVIAFGKYLKIKDLGQKSFELSCSEKEFDEIWKTYFDLDTNYTAIRNKTKNDPFLKRCAAFSEGIRILNQDIITAIINFLILAVVLFCLIKGMNKLSAIGKKKEEEAAAAPAEPSNEEKLLTEIRDLLAKK